jgi:hypothetical protein
MQYNVGTMPTHAVVWDLETVPDLKSFAAANDFVSKSDDEIREARRFGSFATDPFSTVAIGCIADNGRHW